MTASCMISGRIAEKPYIPDTASCSDECWMVVESEKPFSTMEKTTESDRFHIRLWRGIAAECAKAFDKGTVVIVSGRLETEFDGHDDVTRIIAEKVQKVSVRAGKK